MPLDGCDGLYRLGSGNDIWLCCAYKDKDVYKKYILDLTNRIAQASGTRTTTEYDWEFHHVIEKQHLADIPLEALGLGNLVTYYDEMIPTIIINKAEHKTISSYLHVKEFRELYLFELVNQSSANAIVSTRATERQKVANSNLSSRFITEEDVIRMIDNMAWMYGNAYRAHPIFQVISKNFFNVMKKRIIFG